MTGLHTVDPYGVKVVAGYKYIVSGHTARTVAEYRCLCRGWGWELGRWSLLEYKGVRAFLRASRGWLKLNARTFLRREWRLQYIFHVAYLILAYLLSY